MYFYAVPTIAHDHAYSRCLKHCRTICHTWRTTGKTIHTKNASSPIISTWFETHIVTTYFHHRVPHNLTKCLCPFPASHKCNQLFNTLQSSSWTATINIIINIYLNDVDTPAKVSCWNVWSLDHIHYHIHSFPTSTTSTSPFEQNPSHTFPQVHSLNRFPPAEAEARCISKTSKGYSAFCGKGRWSIGKLRGPKGGLSVVRLFHAYFLAYRQDFCTKLKVHISSYFAPSYKLHTKMTSLVLPGCLGNLSFWYAGSRLKPPTLPNLNAHIVRVQARCIELDSLPPNHWHVTTTSLSP